MRIKYMGSSHRHTLKKGDTFSGRLSDGLTKDVEFNRQNNWTVDTSEAELSAPAVEVLLQTNMFKDVTDLKSIPTNEHQKIFLGMGARSELESGTVETTDDDSPSGEDKPQGDEPAKGSALADADTTTTVGGSTASTGGSRRGTRAGGST